ncbi:MAG: DUF748 domain-containing protein [Firmicutes bacterium]|nr:DUF748 domain-containing protein [Bacillota bacterium]
MSFRTFFHRLSRLNRRLLWGAASVLLLYTGLGFLAAPPLLKRKLPQILGQKLGREVRLQKVRINPFALSATLEGFRILEPNGEDFLALERLYINANVSSLLGRTLSLEALELDRPSGRLVLEKGGRLNISDILDRLNAEAPAPEPQKTAMALHLAHLKVRGASFHFMDRSLSKPFATTIGPLSLDLEDFHTEAGQQTPYRLKGRTESGETFAWNGQFSLEPLASEGTLELSGVLLPKYSPYYRDQVAFELRRGLASLQVAYEFQWSEQKHVLKLKEGSLDLDQLQLAEERQTASVLDLPKLEARGFQGDLLARKVEIRSLLLRDGKVDLVRQPQGLNLARLFTPKPQPKPKEPSEPFAFTFRELGLRNARVSFTDQTTERPVATVAEKLDVTFTDFSLDPKKATPLKGSLVLDGDTTLEVEGRFAFFKPAVDLTLKLEKLRLATFDPYASPALDIQANRGLASLTGHLQGDWQGKASDFTAFQGEARFENLELMDGAEKEPFLRYREARVKGFNVDTRKNRLSIESVELTGHEHRLVVAKDGRTNLARAFNLQTPAPSKSGAVLGSAVPPSPAPESGLEVLLARLMLKPGRLAYLDRSMEPNAALIITDLEGENVGLSSQVEGRSSLTLTGKAGGLAPLSIRGYSMPLNRDRDTDVTIRIQGAELSDFSPYTRKFLGYTVRKGKLDLDATVKIEHRKLKALVKTRLDQFYLGDKVPSPDATSLPVKLGLALLRDRKGVIDVELPIEGSLDDPDFRYGKLVWQAILNLLTKAVTSPFTLLGNLFGGGQDLSHIVFEPGSVALAPDAQAKLKSLVQAMTERPELNLEVEGTVDAQADAQALKKAQLERRLKQAKLQHLQSKQPDLAFDQITLDAQERDRYLETLFKATFPPPQGQKPTPQPPPNEMEQRLLATLETTPQQLRALAARRTRTVVKALTENTGLEPRRIFSIQEGAELVRNEGAKVQFKLN